MTTVFEKFGIHYACWRNYGPCSAAHTTHIHVSMNPSLSGKPKCAGGSAGWDYPPGSPQVLAFKAEVYKRYPKLHGPGPGDGIFNCRDIAGSSTWSDHAYANAIDLAEDPSYLDQVYDWITGNWEEEEDMTPEQDKRLTRVEDDVKAIQSDVKAMKTDFDSLFNRLDGLLNGIKTTGPDKSASKGVFVETGEAAGRAAKAQP